MTKVRLNQSPPSNTKIQRAGPDVPGQRIEFLPAADLERSKEREDGC
jgi:hypothetical protein